MEERKPQEESKAKIISYAPPAPKPDSEKIRKANELFLGVGTGRPSEKSEKVSSSFSEDLLDIHGLPQTHPGLPGDDLLLNLGGELLKKPAKRWGAPKPEISNSQVSLISISPKNEPLSPKISQMVTLFTPLVVTTEEVGEQWGELKNERKVRVELTRNFQVFVEITSQQVGLHVVEVIGEEAILAGKSQEMKCFVHLSKSGNSIEAIVVTEDDSLSEKIAILVSKAI